MTKFGVASHCVQRCPRPCSHQNLFNNLSFLVTGLAGVTQTGTVAGLLGLMFAQCPDPLPVGSMSPVSGLEGSKWLQGQRESAGSTALLYRGQREERRGRVWKDFSFCGARAEPRASLVPLSCTQPWTPELMPWPQVSLCLCSQRS